MTFMGQVRDIFLIRPSLDPTLTSVESFTLLTFSRRHMVKIQLSAAKMLLIPWVLGSYLKCNHLRTCVRKQRAGGCRDGGERRLQPYGCQRREEQHHVPENTATTSCILYKQFSSLLSSVKCNVLRHLNKINIAVELYLEPCEISLVKLPARQNMPPFRFLYHLKLHLGLSEGLLLKSVGEHGLLSQGGRGRLCLPLRIPSGRFGQTRAGSGEPWKTVEFLPDGRSKKQMMRRAADGN